jgi:hypothetical protein
MEPAIKVKEEYDKMKCHYCKSRDIVRGYILCSNYPRCRCAFCDDCLRDVFRTDANTLKRTWECMVCKNICNCKKCDEKRLLRTQLNIDERIVIKSSQKRQCKGTKVVKRKNKDIINSDSKEEEEYSTKNTRKKKVKRKHTIRKPPKLLLDNTSKEVKLGKNIEEEKSNRRPEEYTPAISPSICALYGTLPIDPPQHISYPVQVQYLPCSLIIQEIYPQPMCIINQTNQNSAMAPLLYTFPISNIKEECKPAEDEDNDKGNLEFQ